MKKLLASLLVMAAFAVSDVSAFGCRDGRCGGRVIRADKPVCLQKEVREVQVPAECELKETCWCPPDTYQG